MIVFWDLNENNLEKCSQELWTFISKYRHIHIMIFGPCESTVKCEFLVKQLLKSII